MLVVSYNLAALVALKHLALIEATSSRRAPYTISTPSATAFTDLPRQNHVNHALSVPPTPPSASAAVARAPSSSHDNFSSARLSKFCKYAIPTFLTLCHDPSGSATSKTRQNTTQKRVQKTLHALKQSPQLLEHFAMTRTLSLSNLLIPST